MLRGCYEETAAVEFNLIRARHTAVQMESSSLISHVLLHRPRD